MEIKMTTANDLLKVAQDLVRDLGGDSPIAYTILTKEDVKDIMLNEYDDDAEMDSVTLFSIMSDTNELMPSCIDILEGVISEFVDSCNPQIYSDEEEEKEMDKMEDDAYQRYQANEHFFDGRDLDE